MIATLSTVNGTVNVEGVRLTYYVEGEGLAVFVIGSAIYYPRTFSAQFKASARVAYADMRHFAACDASVNQGSIRLSTYMSDIERVREAIGFERFVLIGHSHHGNLALEYAKQYAERVSHLVLVGTPPCDVQQTIAEAERYWKKASKERKVAHERNWALLGLEKHALMSAEEAFVAQYVADGPKYWYDTTYDAGPLWKGVPLNMAALSAFKGFFADYAFLPALADVNTPILVVMGKHDYAVPHTLWRQITRNLGNVTYRLLDKCGHTPQLEVPEEFDQILLEWLENEAGSLSLGHTNN